MTTADWAKNFRYLLALGLLFILSNCVSVNITPDQAQKAEKISYEAPATPFKQFKTESADKAWQSEKTGNTMAFLTECNQNVDTSLKSLQFETLNALSDLQINQNNNVTFEDREGLIAQATGKVDGVPVELSVLVFKKNGCNFTLSYMGRRQHFQSESRYFEKFKESFKVP